MSDEVVSILFGSTWHADVFTLAPIQGGLPAILPEYPEIRIDTAYLGGSHPNPLRQCCPDKDCGAQKDQVRKIYLTPKQLPEPFVPPQPLPDGPKIG